MDGLVSVIIPTLNSASTIRQCLQALGEQTYKDIEIVVVDNYSTDETRAIAQEFTTKVFQKGPERTAQKNYGISQAHGEFVLLIDSDMLLEPSVIQECVELIGSKTNGGGVCIPVVDRGTSMWIRVLAFERSLYKGTLIEAARFLRKDLLEKVGLYSSEVIFLEEFIPPQKIEQLGYEVHLRTKGVLYHLFYEFSLRLYLRKKFYYGKTVRGYQKASSIYASKQLSPIYRYMLFFKNPDFYKSPILALGIICLKSLEFMAGGCGYIMSFFKKS